MNIIDLAYSFCRASTENTVVDHDLSVMYSSAELFAMDLYSLANSLMKRFRTEPNGTRKRFIFQCTTSLYASFMLSMKVAESTLPQEKEASAMGDGLGREGGGG